MTEAKTPTTGQKFADAVASCVGSWKFIIIQSLVLFTWVACNADSIVHFDPYPFILLNLFLSFQAAYTAPFILMSQNRQGEIDRGTLNEDLQADLAQLADIRELRAEIAALSTLIERLRPAG